MHEPLEYQSPPAKPPVDKDGVSGKWVIAGMGVIALVLSGLIIWLAITSLGIAQ